MKICLLLLLLPLLSFRPMGMSYYIEPNVKTPCHNNFPSGLSFLFEQVSGYGDKSMVAQVEKILNVDLSTFQQYDYPENRGEAKRYWKNIKDLNSLLDRLLIKVKANPAYHKQVKYTPIVPVYGYTSDSSAMAEIEKSQVAYASHPMYGYPNDVSYLSTEQFTNDIKALKALLKCYARSGATKVKLSYY